MSGQEAASRVEREVVDFSMSLIPFGSMDVRDLVQTALDAGKDGDWAAEKILEFVDDTGSRMEDVDPNYVIYDALLQEARGDIEAATGTDILSDLNEEVTVCGNYMCTTLDFTEKARSETLAVIARVPEGDRTDAIKWLTRELE